MHITQLMVIGACRRRLRGGARRLRRARRLQPGGGDQPEQQRRAAHAVAVHALARDQELPRPLERPGGLGLSLATTSGQRRRSPPTGSRSADRRSRPPRKACAKLSAGGGGPPPRTTAQQKQSALEFAECMRTHGVPSFPDPTFSTGGGAKVASQRRRCQPGSPAFQQAVERMRRSAAAETCRFRGERTDEHDGIDAGGCACWPGWR